MCPERLDVSKFFGVVFDLQTLFMREKKALARSCIHAGSSEPSPHADVIRTIISCADQFIVLIFHCGPLFSFLIQYYNLNDQISKHCQSALSRLFSLLVIQINSRCLFLTMGSKLLRVYICKAFHR